VYEIHCFFLLLMTNEEETAGNKWDRVIWFRGGGAGGRLKGIFLSLTLSSSLKKLESQKGMAKRRTGNHEALDNFLGGQKFSYEEKGRNYGKKGGGERRERKTKKTPPSAS